jgi:hypothetical protein
MVSTQIPLSRMLLPGFMLWEDVRGRRLDGFFSPPGLPLKVQWPVTWEHNRDLQSRGARKVVLAVWYPKADMSFSCQDSVRGRRHFVPNFGPRLEPSDERRIVGRD